MGRKPLGDKARVAIAARISREAYEALMAEKSRAGSLGKAIDAAAKLLPKKRSPRPPAAQ